MPSSSPAHPTTGRPTPRAAAAPRSSSGVQRALGHGLIGAGLLLSGLGASAAPRTYQAGARAQWDAQCAACHRAGATNAPGLVYLNRIDAALKNLADNDADAFAARLKTKMPSIDIDDLKAIHPLFLQARDGAVNTTALDFPDTQAGQTSEAKTIVVYNDRDEAVDLSYHLQTGPGFIIDPPGACPNGIPAQGRCEFKVTFQPPAEDTYSGSWTFLFPNSPLAADKQAITFKGKGVAGSPPGGGVSVVNPGIFPKPRITASPSTLSFDAQIDTTQIKSVTVSNVSLTDVLVGFSVIDIRGPDAAWFKLIGNNDDMKCALESGNLFMLGKLQPCKTHIEFKPTQARNGQATLHLEYTGQQVLEVPLVGRGALNAEPHIEGTTQLNFGDTLLGAPSAAKTLALKNSGAGPLTLTTLKTVGPQASEFSPASPNAALPLPLQNRCTEGRVLSTNEVCSLPMVFIPTAEGLRTAEVEIQSNAPEGALKVQLSGRGVTQAAPALSLSANALNFGAQTLGKPYPAQVLTLHNTGSSPVNGLSAMVQGPGYSLAAASSCGAQLAPDAQCTLAVSYQPTVLSLNDAGELKLNSTAPGSPHTVSLSGRAVDQAVPALNWVPADATALPFAPVAIGGVSPAQTIKIHNTGPGTAHIAEASASGPQASDFRVDASACKAQALAAGADCALSVSFGPSAADTRRATLDVQSDGNPLPALTLEGSGLSAPTGILSLSPTALSFGPTPAGTRSGPQTLTLGNSGTPDLMVTQLTPEGPFELGSSTCGALPWRISGGQHCQVSVVYAPTTADKASGRLTVHSNATEPLVTVALNGGTDSASASSDDSGGGGCTISRGRESLDPTLFALAALAAGGLWRRRGRRSQQVARRP